MRTTIILEYYTNPSLQVFLEEPPSLPPLFFVPTHYPRHSLGAHSCLSFLFFYT